LIGWNDELLNELGAHGHSCYIGHNTMILNPEEVVLGSRVRIDPFTLITTKLVTDDNVQVCSHVVLGGGKQHRIQLGHWTFVGYGSKLFCGSEDYSGEYGPVNDFWGSNKVHHGDITIQRFGGVASDVIVMPGVTIPEGCCIGAKSFVYSSEKLEPWSVYFGNPLKLVKRRNKEEVLKKAKDVGFWKFPYLTNEK